METGYKMQFTKEKSLSLARKYKALKKKKMNLI